MHGATRNSNIEEGIASVTRWRRAAGYFPGHGYLPSVFTRCESLHLDMKYKEYITVNRREHEEKKNEL